MNITGAKYVLVIALSAICFACCYSADKIFDDSTANAHLKFHHHFEVGTILRMGNENVRTNNSYDHSTTRTSNYAVGKYMRFLSFRLSHAIVFKKVFEAGISYGTDMYIQTHDVRAFVPVLFHVLNNTRVGKKLAIVFTQRAGYSFYFRSRSTDPFIKLVGVQGGFTTETLVGLSIATTRKNYVQLMAGYRFQHLNSKSVFYSDPALTQQGTGLPVLPDKITEVSNGFYHFIYLSLGVPF